MNVLRFIKEMFKEFSFLMMISTILLVLVNLFGAFSLLTISPVVDRLIHPDMQGISPLTQKVIGVFQFFNIPNTLFGFMVTFIVFVALSSVLQVLARYSILKTKYRVLKKILVDTFKDFFNSNWYFFTSGRQGELLNTFTRIQDEVGNAFSAMALFFSNILQTITFLIVPFLISWQVTLISLAAALIFAIPFGLLGRRGYRLGRLTTSTSNHLYSVINENLVLAKIFLGFGNQHKGLATLEDAYKAHLKYTIKSQVLGFAIPILYRPFAVVMLGIALFVSHYFEVSLSETTVLVLALFQVALAVSNLTSQKNSLDNLYPNYEQLKKLRARAIELKQVSGDRIFDGFHSAILVENLTFAYPSYKPILVNINMTIKKGDMVALVGKSGAGKSTLVDILMRLHDPLQGLIKFDGVSLSAFDINSYRQRIGYVPQDSVLFNMSIRDNLLWAKETASPEEIETACRLAHADEFIEKLPLKYDAIVGDRGVRLSGGQIQRVALARALLRKPELLILDEATSSLDSHSEQLIQHAIENIARETTVIAIAHRLSTIQKADWIYVLDNGEIMEQGTYMDLVAKDGHFSSMAHLQELQISAKS